jgi:hypothetical protein
MYLVSGDFLLALQLKSLISESVNNRKSVQNQSKIGAEKLVKVATIGSTYVLNFLKR